MWRAVFALRRAAHRDKVILVIEGKTVRSRLLSPREAARLMGLDDDYLLPERYNHAYHLCGDGVCVPVVRHITARVLEPALVNRRLRHVEAHRRGVIDGDRPTVSTAAVRTLTNEIGSYVLCDLDEVPLYVVNRSMEFVRA